MKAKSPAATWLTQLAAAFAALSLVLEVFIHNQLYSTILKDLNFALPNINSYQTPILVLLFAGLLILIMFGNEKASSGTYDFLWVLLLPSILWFSNVDWFKVLGLPFNFEALAPNLPFTLVLAAGLVLITTRVFFSFVSQIKTTKQELVGRGASEPDTQKALSEQSHFFSKFILACAAAALLIIMVASTARGVLQQSLPPLQYPYVILGLASATLLAICTALYLKSHAEIVKQSPVSSGLTSVNTPAVTANVDLRRGASEPDTQKALSEQSHSYCGCFEKDEKCGAMKRNKLWAFDLWAHARALRTERCRNEFKDCCCYLCNLRQSCTIVCSFPDPRENQGLGADI